MPEETNRALFVAWARQVAAELADLAARGWAIAPPSSACGFAFRKTYVIPGPGGTGPPDPPAPGAAPGSGGVTVQIQEVRGPGGVRIQVQAGGRDLDLALDREAIVALVQPQGYEELCRIQRLIRERLN